MGNLEKNAGNRGHNIISPIILIVALKRAQKSDWGKIWQEGNQIIQCLIKLWET